MLLSEMHATRLFPIGGGVDAYAITGIAARYDWVVLSDRSAPHARLVKRVEKGPPRHVFLSIREPYRALACFVEEVLPHLNEKFVLVSGSGDPTVPRQVDKRWRPFDATERGWIADILAHPKLRMWFAENLDLAADPKMAPLPLGLVFPDGPPQSDATVPGVAPLAGRKLRVLCAHRVRTGAQWEQRRLVSGLARGAWSEFCTAPESEVPAAEFSGLVQQHAFVACVEGGGLDPSPKAWNAIMNGAIPIIRRGPLDAAYRQLPVAFVDDWTADAITPEKLAKWRDAFAPLYDAPEARAEVLRRLGIEHWWAQIEAGRLAEP